MKDIKIRVWEEISKKYYYDIDSLQRNPSIKFSELFSGNDTLKLELGIGLKDKNKTDIYDGDIIDFKANFTSKPGGYSRGVIKWEETRCAFMFYAFNIEEPYCLQEESDEGSYQWEVLGNIHENKNLL
ncbi:MAG: YopX family protein [Gammaproteobacteria bacterium]|nr:YopX family protein [Gammaproteobacteria bacterium]